MMSAILTGSRVYGDPKLESDIDMVALMTHEEYELLCGQADNFEEPDEGVGGWRVPAESLGGQAPSLRFGALNLICCFDQKNFDVWYKGTQELAERRPVTRIEAIAHLNTLRYAAGLKQS